MGSSWYSTWHMVSIPKISYSHQYCLSDLTTGLWGKLNWVYDLANSMILLYKWKLWGSGRWNIFSRSSDSALFNKCSFIHLFRKCLVGSDYVPKGLGRLAKKIDQCIPRASNHPAPALQNHNPGSLSSKISRASSCALPAVTKVKARYKYLWSCPKVFAEFSSLSHGGVSTAPALTSNVTCHS